jgi:hypothetical protein
MRLARVKVGDVVRAGNLHAVVVAKACRVLVVRGVCNGSTRRLRAAEIDVHWRQATRRDAP